MPWEAGFLAGKAFLIYRRARGARTSPLPDFYIGAHAAIEGLPLLTRDASNRYYAAKQAVAEDQAAGRMPSPDATSARALSSTVCAVKLHW